MYYLPSATSLCSLSAFGSMPTSFRVEQNKLHNLGYNIGFVPSYNLSIYLGYIQEVQEAGGGGTFVLKDIGKSAMFK